MAEKKKTGKKEPKKKIRHIPELGMNERQKAFCDYYIETASATEAALMAGYSEKTARQMGSENLSKPYIKSYIKRKMDEKEDERIAKQDEILAYLTSIMRGKHQEQTLVGLGMGEQAIANIDVSAKDRIKAAELIGKRYSMWTEKIELSGDMVVQIYDDIEDE